MGEILKEGGEEALHISPVEKRYGSKGERDQGTF